LSDWPLLIHHGFLIHHATSELEAKTKNNIARDVVLILNDFLALYVKIVQYLEENCSRMLLCFAVRCKMGIGYYLLIKG
jgi:hypothetical protein